MKTKLLLLIALMSSLSAEKLQIKAKSFYADEKKGLSIFEGDVRVVKTHDELNASKVTIYTDKKNQPTKFITEGNSSFKITTLEKSIYMGKADKVIYYPKKKEYHFYKNVHLRQIDEKKEIIGEEVVLNLVDGKAHAKGAKSEPVIMIFDIPEEKEK